MWRFVGQVARIVLYRGLRAERGVLEKNIIGAHKPSAQRGVKLLGAPIGHEDFGLALLAKLTKEIEEEGVLLGRMAASHPMEACRILTAALSKRPDHAARQNSPTSGVLRALDTVDKLMLSVLASILGERCSVSAPRGSLPDLPDLAVVMAQLGTSCGGLGMRPLKRLAELGVLHLATLTQALPRMVERLKSAGAGRMATDIAAEIARVDTSALPWAVQARASHATASAFLGTALPAVDCKVLMELLPDAEKPGEAVTLPPLLQLVTQSHASLQYDASQAVWHRDLLRLHRGVPDTLTRAILRDSCFPGAASHLEPIDFCPFRPSHEAAADRMQPQIWRMAARYWLLMEPIHGMAAALARVGHACPSCGQNLDGSSPLAVTNHLVSCAKGGGTQRTAKGFTMAVQRCCADVGVGSEREMGGLSSISAHRPGDAVTAPMPVPRGFDFGGSHRLVIDTTVKYLSPSNVNSVADERRPPTTEVYDAEVEKFNQLEREVALGVRSRLPAGFTFMGVAMSSRGRRGPRLDRLFDDVAAHGARHTVGLPDEEGAATEALLKARFRARVGVGLHQGLMEAYQSRAQAARREWEERTGLSAVTGAELRFQ